MRTVRTKVYKFKELDPQAKQKAINWYLSDNDLYFVWDDTQEDAKQIGLNIISLDDHRPNKGEFIQGATETAYKIIAEHGENCETHKTAKKFLAEWDALVEKYSDGINKCQVAEDNEYEFDQEADELEQEFLKSLLEDYRIMYNKDIEYNSTDKAAIEAIEANEYEFTKDGYRF